LSTCSEQQVAAHDDYLFNVNDDDDDDDDDDEDDYDVRHIT
jgi:hypothetical protein